MNVEGIFSSSPWCASNMENHVAFFAILLYSSRKLRTKGIREEDIHGSVELEININL